MIEINHATVVFAGSGKDPHTAYAPIHSIFESRGDVRYVAQETLYDQNGLRPNIIDDLNKRLDHYNELTIAGDSIGTLAAYGLAIASEQRRSTRLMLLDGPIGADHLKDEKETIRISHLRGLDRITNTDLLEHWRNSNIVQESHFIRKHLSPEELEWFTADMEARRKFELTTLGGQAVYLANYATKDTLSAETPAIYLQSKFDALLSQPATAEAWKERIPHLEVQEVAGSNAHASTTIYPRAWRRSVIGAFNHLDNISRVA